MTPILASYWFCLVGCPMQKKGIVVADMDLLIASICIANNEKLISNNLGHFSKIDSLEVESWV